MWPGSGFSRRRRAERELLDAVAVDADITPTLTLPRSRGREGWGSGRVAMAGGGSQLVADVALVRRVHDGRNDPISTKFFRYPPYRWINLLETIDQCSEQRGNSPHFKYLLKI